MALTLMKGSEAIAEAAIRAGARYFFGYPITPQTEIPEYMSARMPEVGGCFLQAESEVAAINMIYGAAGAGARALTSSSSPGVSLKQEGISYCAGAQLPAVILNVMRGGPGLGNIQASQGDYFQAVKGDGICPDPCDRRRLSAGGKTAGSIGTDRSESTACESFFFE